MYYTYSVASFFLYLTQIDFVLKGKDEKFDTLVRAVNDGVCAVVINPEDSEVVWLVESRKLLEALQSAHAKYGLSPESGWVQWYNYIERLKSLPAYSRKEERQQYADHERLRFRAYMLQAHRRCTELGVNIVVHRVSIGRNLFWEGEYRSGEMRPYRVTRYEDDGSFRWILFQRQLGQKKRR